MIKNNEIKKMFIAIIFTFVISLVAISPVHSENNNSSENNSVYGVDNGYKSQTPGIPTKKVDSITPASKPCDAKILKYSTYNKYTKNYYTILSYMTKFEKSGGGTLILKKGKYIITNTIAIPSNVNLIFEDGVVIEKGTNTGTSKFKAASSMFNIVPPSKHKTKDACSKYNGAKNVNIIGRGSATIDLKYINGIAITSGHCKNINISGISFKNLNVGHFIEVGATDNLKISNCKFFGSKPTPNGNAEAIGIDVPDINTKGFNYVWSKYDNTNNNNIKIENNVFDLLDCAIGSHKFSQNKHDGKYVVNKGQVYHTNIIIKNNKITNIRNDAIKMLNWKNVEITNNYIANIPINSKNYRGIFGTGINFKIKYNHFANMLRPAQFFPKRNVGAGSMYSITYNDINSRNMEDLKYNLCSNVNERFVYISNDINAYYRGATVIHMRA